MTAPYKADLIAAERLLKAAVRQAVERLRCPHLRCGCDACEWAHRYLKHSAPSPDYREAVADMLAEATRSADLLLGGAR